MFIHKNTNGSFLENWRDKTDVLTLHPNAAKSLMDCISQRLAYAQNVPDCCVIFEDFTEHHMGLIIISDVLMKTVTEKSALE